MSRWPWQFAFVVSLLPACDDGVLRAFEPHSVALGGLGGTDSSPEAGDGHGGTTAGDASAGEGAEGPISPLLIDDFEDGDMRAKEPLGWWYPVNDGTGAQGIGIEPISEGAGSVSEGTGSVYAFRTHGSDFTDWGAAVGVNLAGEATPLNALSSDQLCFTARVEAGSSSSIEVHLLRDPGVHYQRDVSLSETWTRYCLPLADFIGADGGVLMPDELIALQFFFAPQASFELWLDDVEIEP